MSCRSLSMMTIMMGNCSVKNKYWKAFLSGFLNPFGQPTYQELISLPPGEITRRINAKMALRRAETDRTMNEFDRHMKTAKSKRGK